MCVVAWMIYFVYPIPSNGVIETGYRFGIIDFLDPAKESNALCIRYCVFTPLFMQIKSTPP